jgi:hypothetical protein
MHVAFQSYGSSREDTVGKSRASRQNDRRLMPPGEHDGIDSRPLTNLRTCSAIRKSLDACECYRSQIGWPVFTALYYSGKAAASFQYILHTVPGTPRRA